MTVFAAAAAEPHRGWGGPLAILAAFAAMGLIHVCMKRRKNHSPTPPAAGGHRVKPQVSEVSDTSDTSADPPWWGEIVTVGGERMRRARQVWRTGSADLPEEPADAEDGTEIDLELDEPEDVDAWVRHNLTAMKYAELVRVGMTKWGVSESTMKRRIADARKAVDG